jgi:hypothetical protein
MSTPTYLHKKEKKKKKKKKKREKSARHPVGYCHQISSDALPINCELSDFDSPKNPVLLLYI